MLVMIENVKFGFSFFPIILFYNFLLCVFVF